MLLHILQEEQQLIEEQQLQPGEEQVAPERSHHQEETRVLTWILAARCAQHDQRVRSRLCFHSGIST